MTTKRLGKKAARQDTRTLRLSRYLTTALPPAPDAVDYTLKGMPPFLMMANDVIGDCTCAAAGHMIEVWCWNSGQWYVPLDPQIIRAYADITGFDPATGAHDDGAAEIDVLNYWRRVGIADHRIMGYAALDPMNREHIRQAVWLFEGCYIGLQLPISAQTQLDEGGVWEVPLGGIHSGDGAAGSWGGHAVNVVGYDAEGLTVVTWGQLQKMTWAFWEAYCDEAYAVLSADMFAGGAATPAGFDMRALMEDLALVGDLKALDPPPPNPVPYIPAAPKGILLILVETGLGTDPTGDCCGLRALAQKIAAAHPEYDTRMIFHGWDENPNQFPPNQTTETRRHGDDAEIEFLKNRYMDSPCLRASVVNASYTAGPDGLSRWLKDRIVALAPAKLIALRHSFGGGYGVFFDQWLWNWYSGPAKDAPPLVFDLVVAFDPVPNGVRFGEGQGPGWFDPLAVVKQVLCFYQRGGLLLGIKGEPVFEQIGQGVANVDVTGWREPRLGHVTTLGLTGIIEDSRVENEVMAAVRGVLCPQRTQMTEEVKMGGRA